MQPSIDASPLDYVSRMEHKRKRPVRGAWCEVSSLDSRKSDCSAVLVGGFYSTSTLHRDPLLESELAYPRPSEAREMTAESGQALKERLIRATLCHLRPGPEMELARGCGRGPEYPHQEGERAGGVSVIDFMSSLSTELST
jgi:hypothetical protein